ncbi:MAG: acyl-CoA dehydrogenase family protein [Betaproteobacteria bacterium]|nr:MAG: acyl-CoA dehydrogenase family protein [Betaproteobacteria bacterium]
MRDDVIGYLLKAPAGAVECVDVAAWWPRHRELAATWRNPMDRAIAGGFAADRVGWAFACGYQAALHALFPGAPEDRIAALCVTEADGNSPKAIRSTLRREGDLWLLNGAKRWTTLGPDGGLFFVAARDAAASGERAVIRVARVTSDAPGVTVTPMPPTRFVPEVPHAQLQFENVPLTNDALLPGDGYDHYVKRFRTVEDQHVKAAVVAYLVREARRLAWPVAWIERAAALLHGLRAIAGEDASAPATHIALAGALALGTALIEATEPFWNAAGQDPAAPRWRRDRELFAVAGSARVRRTARAWERLRPA